jgi:Zn-dependent peptidase ImmA (M78 family)
MTISRMDLADFGSPERLAIEIFKNEPELILPIPIEELCKKLDITEILPLKTEGYEGGLITDKDKYEGIILFNANSPAYRQRFTISHELGHFLIASHVPSDQDGFLCSQEDMFKLPEATQKQRVRMEIEANLFASRILMPLHFLRRDVPAGKHPDLSQIIELSDRYNVSKEAMCRSYVGLREEPTAMLICLNGKVLRIYKDDKKFPFITVSSGQAIPKQSAFYQNNVRKDGPSDIFGVDAGVWTDVVRGKRSPDLYEQFFIQSAGYSIIMLSMNYEEDEDHDPDENKTSKQRYEERISNQSA